jgi:hypothetical protein
MNILEYIRYNNRKMQCTIELILKNRKLYKNCKNIDIHNI